MLMLNEAGAGFQPSNELYADFTQDAALLLKDWADIRQFRVHDTIAGKCCWQLRCIGQDPDQYGGRDRLRVLAVSGSTTMFALSKYIAEAFGWRPLGKRYEPQPSKGVLPQGSHWIVKRTNNSEVVDENETKLAGIVGSQKAVFKAAGKGAPFFHEKKIKLFQLLESRGDTMIFLCDGGRKVTVQVDGCTGIDPSETKYTPRCVGADASLPRYAWVNLNYEFLKNKPAEMVIFSSRLTEEEIDDAIRDLYQIPLFDNRGQRFDKRNTANEEMHRVVALPFIE